MPAGQDEHCRAGKVGQALHGWQGGPGIAVPAGQDGHCLTSKVGWVLQCWQSGLGTDS